MLLYLQHLSQLGWKKIPALYLTGGQAQSLLRSVIFSQRHVESGWVNQNLEPQFPYL